MNSRRRQIFGRAMRMMWRFRLRSSLLILSAGLGLSGVVCSVNYGASGTEQLLAQIRQMGMNLLIITPAESRSIAGRARTGTLVTTLVERDYYSIRSEIPSQVRSSAIVTQSFWTKAGDFSKNAVVVGCEPSYFQIKSWLITDGRVFDSTEERSESRVVLLGRTVAADLFGASSPVGQRMMINRVPFTVIGVLTERGQGLDVSNEDAQLYVPLTTAMRRLMNVDHFGAIVLELASLEYLDRASDQIRSLLRRMHHVRQNQADDFQIQNQKDLLDTQTSTGKRLGYLLRWISACALVVSGLGIVAISWIAVKERTQEIGTCRALGATTPDIFFQVTCETLAAALIGGSLGAALSRPISRFLSNSSRLPFVFDIRSALMAFTAAALLNLTFAILPAMRAASTSPVEALRNT
jgi:putative ABC transport system permease protein